jgi:acyl-CoA thioesterase I
VGPGKRLESGWRGAVVTLGSVPRSALGILGIWAALASPPCLAGPPPSARTITKTPTPQKGALGRPVARYLAPRAGGVVSNPPGCALAADADRSSGTWEVGSPTPAQPARCAFDVGKGSSRLLVFWQASGNPNYQDTTYGGPGSYVIETSADSTDGTNGTWLTAVAVADNQVMNRAHVVPFGGQRWLRFSVTGKSPQTYEYGVQLDVLHLHDVSRGHEDTWLFVGDSITAEVFRGGKFQPSFAARVTSAAPTYSPVFLAAGVGYSKSSDLRARWPQWMEWNADVLTWAIGIGSNNSPQDAAGFRADLEALVKPLLAAGKLVMLARIPWQANQDMQPLNVEIDAVVDKYKLHKGPDFYAHFKAHPQQLRDGLHPTDEGAREMHRLWAEAVRDLYPGYDRRPR